MINLSSNCGPDCSLPSATVRMCCLSEGKTEYLQPDMEYYSELLRAQEMQAEGKKLERAMLEKIQEKEYKETTKQELLLDEVVIPYLLNGNTDMRDHLIGYKQEFQVEKALANQSKVFTHTDVAHQDFSDGSDSKVGGVYLTVTKKTKKGNESNSFSFGWKVTGVVSSAGIPKSGALRITMVNVFDKTVRYYFLPKEVWNRPEVLTRKNVKGRFTGCDLNGSWRKDKEYTFGNETLSKYEVDSFEILANKQ